MGISNVNQNQEKPVKITKTGNNAYQYEYADGTIKCVFEEKNSVTYNKNQNPDIQVKNDWGDVSVFNGKNVKVDIGKHCTGVTLEKCKDSYVNARHNNTNAIRIEDSTNLTIDADPDDMVSTNGKDIKHPRYETFKVNDKTYTKDTKLSDADGKPQDRVKIYDEKLFNGSSPKNVKLEKGMFKTGLPVGGVQYRKASFPNGDVVIRTENGQYLEYNSKNNKALSIQANASEGLNIKNANGLTYIDTKINNSGMFENSANCTYNSNNDTLNYFETINCKNINIETDSKDEIKVNGHQLDPKYGKRFIK